MLAAWKGKYWVASYLDFFKRGDIVHHISLGFGQSRFITTVKVFLDNKDINFLYVFK